MARAATTPLPRSGHYTAATLKTYEGARVRMDLRGGDLVLVRVRKVWRLHLRVVHSNGRYASIPISRIVRVSLAELDQRAAKRSPILPRSSTLLPKLPPPKRVPGRILRNIGMGLTLAGGSAMAVVAGLNSTSEYENDATVRSVGIASLVVLLAGIPPWVAGSVRTKTHAGNPHAHRSRKLYRRLGMGLTFSGLGLAALGGGVGGAILANYNMDLDNAGSVVGLVMVYIITVASISTGLLASLFVGVPMWIAAVTAPEASGSTGPKQRSHAPVPPPTAMGYVPDPHHQQWTGRRALTHQPRAHIFTVGGRF